MYKFLTKNGQAMALGLGLAVIALFFINISSGFNAAGYTMSTELNKLPDAEQSAISFFDNGIAITLFMIAAAFFLAFVVFGIAELIKFPKGAIKIVGGLLVIGIIFFALYSSATFHDSGRFVKLNDDFGITENISKFISGGIKTTLGLLGFSVLALVGGELWSLIK